MTTPVGDVMSAFPAWTGPNRSGLRPNYPIVILPGHM